MKPKDVKSPFSWEGRVSFYQDRILYVPEYFEGHSAEVLPSWNDSLVFGNNNPVFIEFCSGNGEWIIDKAMANPHVNWVAVEMLFKRVRKIVAKRENRAIKNLMVVCGEALTFCTKYLSDNTAHGAFVNFPDPWPKDRHAKHRLIKTDFATELTRILTLNSPLRLVTDDRPYCDQMIEQVRSVPTWNSIHPEPYFAHESSGYGTSYFERLWREKGKLIHYLEFLNKK